MFYIIRHGQTVWNTEKRKQGQKDSPLTIKGIDQAVLVADAISKTVDNISNYKIVMSPQWRCQQFASIICEKIQFSFSECIIEEDIREHCFGLWEGKTEPEIEIEFPNFLEKRYKPENYWTYIIPMGESYELLSKRVGKVVEKYKENNVIFICHEMVSKVMRGYILSSTKEKILHSKHPQNIIYQIDKNKNIKNIDIER